MKKAFDALQESNEVYNVLKGFFGEASQNLKIEFDVVDNLPNDANNNPVNGKCLYNSNSDIIKIQINKAQANGTRTPLMVARTMVHEAIHAELIRRTMAVYNTNGPKPECGVDVPSSFEDLWCYTKVYGTVDGQHEYMADHYVNTIAAALKEMHPKLSTQNWINFANNESWTTPWSWDDFFRYTAWHGLEETSEFVNQINSSSLTKFNFYKQQSKTDSKCN